MDSIINPSWERDGLMVDDADADAEFLAVNYRNNIDDPRNTTVIMTSVMVVWVRPAPLLLPLRTRCFGGRRRRLNPLCCSNRFQRPFILRAPQGVE